jgi:D-alanine-D-alanine ligase-like ATP-grasp enzyme
MKTRIGIIFGGRSGEHEISVRSAVTVIEQIDKDKYEVVPIAISKEGKWLNPVEALEAGAFSGTVAGFYARHGGAFGRHEL